MPIKNEPQTGAAAEMRLIPVWAWSLAGLSFAAAQVIFNIFMGGGSGSPPTWMRFVFGILAGTVLGVYFLLLGYISRDARRRGMSPALWLCISTFIPNAFGILLYFILRQPPLTLCPQCGVPVRAGFNFCPRCSYKLSASCPQCNHEISPVDLYCPHCGTSLQLQPSGGVASSA